MLKLQQGEKRHFKKKDVTVDHLTGVNADERFIHVPLMMAERAWSFAMQLRQEANTEPRKKFHLVNRLKKACFYALKLQELCNVTLSHCLVCLPSLNIVFFRALPVTFVPSWRLRRT